MPVMLIALLVYYLRVNSQEEEHERIHSGAYGTLWDKSDSSS
jgi:hypothetical protein